MQGARALRDGPKKWSGGEKGRSHILKIRGTLGNWNKDSAWSVLIVWATYDCLLRIISLKLLKDQTLQAKEMSWAVKALRNCCILWLGAARIGAPCQGVQGYRATGFGGKYQPLRFVDSGASRMEIWRGKSGRNGTGTRKLEVKAMS